MSLRLGMNSCNRKARAKCALSSGFPGDLLFCRGCRFVRIHQLHESIEQIVDVTWTGLASG
jgi:hypothetical protein